MKSSSTTQPQPNTNTIRFGQRSSLEVPVQLAVDGRMLGNGTIRNASISGALVESAVDLPLHTNLVVTLKVPAGEAYGIRELSACVVRIDPAGFGIEWRDMGCVDVMDLVAGASKNGLTK
jgi:hypothetical protein